MLALLCAGCSRSKRNVEPVDPSASSAIPLTPALWFSPSLTTAALPYRNACDQPATFSITGPVVDALPQKLSRVLTGVHFQSDIAQAMASDGVIEAGLGVKQIDLVIPRQVAGRYPATVTLGMELVFLAGDGTFIFSKKLQGVGRGEVEVTDQSCDVKGLEPIVQGAVDSVTEGLARQLGESVKVREYAAQPRARASVAAVPRPPTPGSPVGGVPGNGIAPLVGQTGSSEAMPRTAALTFHAIMRDESQDQLLQQDESLMIEVEVRNDGMAEAKGVEVVVEGMHDLAALFPPVVLVGDIRPGEVKRTSVTKRVVALKEAVRGELVLSLRSASPVASIPPAKKFTLFIKPLKTDAVTTVQDVDHLPKSIGAFKHSKTVVIAIGVGRFRDSRMPSVKHAGHDAEVVAEYFREIGNIPDERVLVLRDSHALKQDLIDAFDEWLPQRVDAGTVVYVFFAGRGLVDGATGAVSLIPFDGATAALSRLYSLRSLQQSLYRLPVQRAIMMFDVSLDPWPGANPASTPAPIWETGASERKDQVMWMVGNRGLQEAHAYEQGKHGLFTYHLLRGLQGMADLDRDGTVGAGELCTYVRGEVARAAKEQFGNEQEPLCIPPVGQGAMVRIHPVAKGNNPKPAVTTKKPEPAPELSPQVPKPMEVGPGL
jgi:hypothetical protein